MGPLRLRAELQPSAHTSALTHFTMDLVLGFREPRQGFHLDQGPLGMEATQEGEEGQSEVRGLDGLPNGHLTTARPVGLWPPLPDGFQIVGLGIQVSVRLCSPRGRLYQRCTPCLTLCF